MRGLAIASCLLLVFAPGCTKPQRLDPLQADTITPGTWIVSNSTDYVLVWGYNRAPRTVVHEWQMAPADGSPLPAGWNITFEPRFSTFAPAGTREGGEAKDWQFAVATIKVPPNEAVREVKMKLNPGTEGREVRLRVESTKHYVARFNDYVVVKYKGTFEESGQLFAEENTGFGTTVGSASTVTGFDLGLLGLKLGETVKLVLPPALAYGYENVEPQYARFNGKWLVYEVNIVSRSR